MKKTFAWVIAGGLLIYFLSQKGPATQPNKRAALAQMVQQSGDSPDTKSRIIGLINGTMTEMEIGVLYAYFIQGNKSASVTNQLAQIGQKYNIFT